MKYLLIWSVAGSLSVRESFVPFTHWSWYRQRNAPRKMLCQHVHPVWIGSWLINCEYRVSIRLLFAVLYHIPKFISHSGSSGLRSFNQPSCFWDALHILLTSYCVSCRMQPTRTMPQHYHTARQTLTHWMNWWQISTKIWVDREWAPNPRVCVQHAINPSLDRSVSSLNHLFFNRNMFLSEAYHLQTVLPT